MNQNSWSYSKLNAFHTPLHTQVTFKVISAKSLYFCYALFPQFEKQTMNNADDMLLLQTSKKERIFSWFVFQHAFRNNR